MSGACLSHTPAHDRAPAALVYGDVSRDLVLSLNYQGRREGPAVLGGWMANAGADLLHEADLIVPAPLHDIRLVRCGFNQPAWLAAELSWQSGVNLSADALKGVEQTPIQSGLSAEGRRGNVQGAFQVRKSRVGLVKDQKNLLVDDVLTTGATVEACARTLRRAGAACVDVVALARVAGPRAVPI